ncbi:MAG: hypothetical protein JXA42_25965 [Anaerolineales bacterium]|nr:hypothetical protein [Anaerolineales bacterium]
MTASKKRLATILGILQVFIGIGAVPPGIMVIIEPSGASMGVSVDMLEGSLFPNFLIPGIFLLLVNGIGSLVGAILAFKKHPFAGKAGIGLGMLLLMWIIVQVISLGPPLHWLQILYFILGAIELILGWQIDSRTA